MGVSRGFTYEKITLIGTKSRLTAKGLVDTGTMLTVISQSIAKKVGTKALGVESVLTGNKRAEFIRAGITIRFKGKEFPSLVWINPNFRSDTVIIGVTTLGVAGYDVSPRTKKLVKAKLFAYNLALT